MFQPEETELTVLSFGAGQDSAALREKYIADFEFRKKYAPNRFLMIMADTGDEHFETYEEVERTKQRCSEKGIEFVFLTKAMGYHSEAWQDLIHQYKRNNNVGSKAFKKTCTVNLKIEPIYRFLADWLRENYTVCTHHTRKKDIYTAFSAVHGKINMMIGIAAGEEKRVKMAENKLKNEPAYRRDNIEKIYPLIDMGMDRFSCQQYIRSRGQIVPVPSFCKRCPFSSLAQLLEIYYTDRKAYEEWVVLEQNKIIKFKDKEKTPIICKDTDVIKGYANKNVGVFGDLKLLPEKLIEAKEKHGDLITWDENGEPILEKLIIHNFFHGHCVSQSY
jgi:3'-phosphoadenosine 5'-phosphosulfate sulfotransferase (PAPS reductase)/FAD synthetase